MLLLESLFSVIDSFKSMSELMSCVVLFTGQTAEQYVIDGVTIYCSAACPVNNTTSDISSDIDLKIPITENSDSINHILFSCLSSKQYNKRPMSELMLFVVLFTGQTAEQYVIDGVTILSYWYF
jgi:hypothetical protein